MKGHKCESIDKHPVLLWAPTKRISDLKCNNHKLYILACMNKTLFFIFNFSK